MNCLRAFIVFLFLVAHASSVAQKPVQIHFTEKEGLPDKEFYNVAEDSKGFIWLAGNKGLTRYDGTSFVTLEHPDKRGLSVFQLQVDHLDRVWCINISGQLFYTDGDELILYADLKDELRGNLAEVTVTSKYITLLTNFILIIFDKETGVKRTIAIANQSLSYPVVLDDEIYFMLNNQMVKVTGDDLETQYDIALDLRSTKTYRTGTIKLAGIDDKTMLLYAHNENLEIILYTISKNATTKVEVPRQLKNKQIVAIKKVNDTYWWLTDKGAFTFKIINESLFLQNNILPGKYVTDVASDVEGNLWLTTLSDGLYVLPNLSIDAINFPDKLGLITRMAAGAGDDILIGFSNGDVVVFNIVTNESTVVHLPENRRISTFLFNKEEAQYWYFQDINTYSASVTAPADYSKLPFGQVSVKSIVSLGSDRYAFGNSMTVAIGSRKSLEDLLSSENSNFFIEKRGYKVFQSQDQKHLYFATVDELIALDQSFKSTVIKTKDFKDILGQSITQTDDGHLWVGTFTNGVYEILGTEIIAHHTEENGLLSNRTSVVAAQGNNVWTGTDRGLQLIKRSPDEEIIFKSLTKQDGILSYDIKDIVVAGASAFIATGNQIFHIKTDEVFKTYAPAKLYVTNVMVNAIEQPLKEHYEMQQGASDFMVRFNANGFRGLSNGSFKYRLSGYNDTWTDLRQGDNDVQYASLPSGNFTFELAPAITLTDADNIISIKLAVKVPFYKTIWFYLLVASLIIAAVILYYRRQLSRKERLRAKERERLQLANQLTALKLENLQSQMNPHFIFNALNSIQDYIVHNEKDLASNYLVKFSRLIRMYLEQSRKNSITLDDELQAMRLYLQLEKVRFEDKLDYDLEVDSSVIPSQCEIPPLFIQPYLENAIKHGLLHRKDGRRLKVHFKYDVVLEILEVIVEDNGIGRVATQAIKDAHPSFHKSFATQANDNRVALLNKNRTSKIEVTIIDLYDDNNVGSGTRVTLKIPN